MPIGLDFVVPFVGDPDPTLPFASSIDARLNPGSLFLVEPTHTSGSWGAGVATGAKPNVAASTAAALIGGDPAVLGATFVADAADATKFVFERTGKGGLHFIASATARGGKTGGIRIPSAFFTWWLTGTNKSRATALFIWERITRVAPNVGNLVDQGIFNNASGAGNNLFAGSLGNTVGLTRMAVHAPTGWAGSPNADNGLNAGGVSFGNSPPYAGLNSANGKSIIIYSAHVVDVLASGMSFAQLDAIDAAAYAEAFAAGGRFAGDTFSDPATVIAS